MQIDVFGLNTFDSIREALRYAKELTGIPRGQQSVRQWIVTGNQIYITETVKENGGI